MDYGINRLNGLTNSFRISEIRVAHIVHFLETCYIRKSSVCLSICPFMANSFAIPMVFAIYCFKLAGCILFNQQSRKPSKKLSFSPFLPSKFKPQPL